MTTVSFIEKLKNMKLTSFRFTEFERKVSGSQDDGDRMTYLTFKLETPIERVTSTNFEYDPKSGERLYPWLTDVEYVTCKLETIEKYADEFTFDEKDDKLLGSGSYEGDLFFDLSKSSMQVWLTDVKFAKLSADWKQKGREKRYERFRNLGLGEKKAD